MDCDTLTPPCHTADGYALDFRLKQILKSKGLTQKDAAALAGLSPSTICDLIKRRHKMPEERSLIALCVGLGIKLSDLLVIQPKPSE